MDATAETKSGEASQETDSQEVTVELRGDEGTQPKKLDVDAIIRRRVNRANKQVNAAKGDTTQAQQELVAANEKNKLLELALQQAKAQPETVKPPDPNDFDDGAQDARYVTALNGYTDNRIAEQVKQHVAKIAPQAPTVDNELESKRVNHYRRSVELNAKDYEDTEDKAIGILGQSNVDHIIRNHSKSTELLYYLGKNPGKAEEIANYAVTDPYRAVSALGALEANLTVKRTAKANQAPDPDTELEGTSPNPTSGDDKKLESLRTAAATGDHNDMKALMEFKRTMKEKRAST